MSIINRHSKVTLLLFLIFTCPTQANISGDIGDFYDGLGLESKVNNPSAYKGQEANYYSGGSLTVKSGIRDSNLFNVTMPDISAGCGGIDMFLGGFSHISADQISEMGKSIISNAAPFAVDLALQTWAPQIKGIKDRLQSIADQFNNLSVNSCESAQSLVGGLWPFKTNSGQKYICETMGAQNNMFSDWAAGMQECGEPGSSDNVLDIAKNDPALTDMVKKDTNLVWSSLRKTQPFQSDNQLAEFFMSLSGTIVYDSDAVPHKFQSLLSNNNNLIEVLLNGGDVEIYQCSNHATCLSPSRKKINLGENDGLKSKVTKVLTSLVAKYQNDSSLSDTEKGFLELTQLPVFSMMATTLESGMIPRVSAYSEAMSKDFIAHYLTNAMQTVQALLDSSLMDPEDTSQIINDINIAHEFLERIKTDAMDKLIMEQKLVEQAQALEKRIHGSFSSKTQNNLGFGK